MKVLIVGAGGFIGGFIAREALSRGYETWCGVRESTSRRYLTDPALKFITLDYDDPQKLTEQLKDGQWDYVVYNLGATKCVNFSDFNQINYVYLRNFCEAMINNNQHPAKFLYMSSLSAIGPGDEKNYSPLTNSMIPQPNTRYGLSKIKAETLLQTLPAEFPWIILRPTGVYGPHEQDYLMMIKSIDSHFDFGVGFRRQMLTFIYVEDLARAVFDALENAPVHRKYIISEPRAYSQKEFRRIVARELGRRLVVPVRLPLWALKIACSVSEKYGAAKMQAVTLNSDKYNIMAQRNWACDISDAQRDFGFSPQIDLEEGIRRTVRAYLTEKEAEKQRKKKNA
ncbi:NAD(P)-dependent oxidoreductase [Duncaniella sp.]|uniref:NAD-dependent epimerase/dehydratase family protein n=1 Tax=Duncaniella sp. TaxID=2518496 RepID=UPI0023CE96AF|nr:NAD(P)-dependent oxidoreductase [Duncaniella sp.]MDE5905493.1 NAD(P)-dependent oxidoreductase [Duncaniella sp.]